MTVATAPTTSELAESVANYLASVGGRRVTTRGLTLQTFEIRCGTPDMRNRSPFLKVVITLSRSRALVDVDRWNCKNAPETAREWLETHVWPPIRAYAASTPRRNWIWLPAGGSCDSATVRRADLLPLLREWIPQEIAWQEASA